MKEWLTKLLNKNNVRYYLSHDRTFLNETPDAILELSHNGGKKYIGQYDKYKQQKDIEHETLKLQYMKNNKRTSGY